MSAEPISRFSAAAAEHPPPPTVFCEVDQTPLAQVPVPTYTEEEHGTWSLLLDRQRSLVGDRACSQYLAALDRMPFAGNRIPTLQSVSQVIHDHTGWRLHRVDGLVHPRDFFLLLADRRFPSTDFIRAREELDYTPSPDMFHDLFGHSPLLTDPDFTEFFDAFGAAGRTAFCSFPDGHPIQDAITRLYWFTVEFGLIRNGDDLRAYGAGTISSPEELQHCVGPHCERRPFDPDVVAAHDYDIWHLQDIVYVIDSFPALGAAFRGWAARHGLI